MLEYVAAANAAYSVIKQFVSNGRELSDCASHIAKFVDNKDALAAAHNKRKNSIWSTFTGKQENDLETFMHLEGIRQKEEELKQMMIYLGRPGLHQDYVRFCVEARKQRQQDAKDRARKIEELKENIGVAALWFLGFAALAFVVFVVLYGLQRRGML